MHHFFTMELLDNWMIFDNTEYESILFVKNKCRRNIYLNKLFENITTLIIKESNEDFLYDPFYLTVKEAFA